MVDCHDLFSSPWYSRLYCCSLHFHISFTSMFLPPQKCLSAVWSGLFLHFLLTVHYSIYYKSFCSLGFLSFFLSIYLSIYLMKQSLLYAFGFCPINCYGWCPQLTLKSSPHSFTLKRRKCRHYLLNLITSRRKLELSSFKRYNKSL